MRSFNFKKLIVGSAFGLAAIIGLSESASAQTWRNDQRQERRIDRQQDKIAKQREKLQNQRERLQSQQSRNNRFRVYRNGSWYNTDNRGADLLRQAVNQGYRQGFQAGQQDRNRRRGMSWNNSNVYRSGTFGYQSYVDRSQYQHYFQQGFQRGYQDGYHSRNQFGSNNGGSVNILGTILGSILNIQRY